MCKVDGCNGKVNSWGWCRAHYKRFRRYGDPLGGGSPKAPKGAPMQWLRDNASHDGDDCLIWPFASGDKGYGNISLPGRTSAPAHRVMCRLAHGEPPEERYHAAHSCGKGTSGCVNPKHLRWETPAGNSADKIIHGTVANGERNGSAKLTIEQVREIRSMKGTMSQQKIGARFGVGQTIISEIFLGKAWAGIV